MNFNGCTRIFVKEVTKFLNQIYAFLYSFVENYSYLFVKNGMYPMFLIWNMVYLYCFILIFQNFYSILILMLWWNSLDIYCESLLYSSLFEKNSAAVEHVRTNQRYKLLINNCLIYQHISIYFHIFVYEKKPRERSNIFSASYIYFYS